MSLSALALSVAITVGTTAVPPLEGAIERNVPAHRELYRWFHAHPELSGQEHQTARRMAKELSALGLAVTEGVGTTGVVAVLRNGRGPTVMVRADMDALPITEQTGLPYASQRNDVMHACGHDLHLAMMVGVAQALVELRDRWQGTLVFVVQPAEEIGTGALGMIDDGLFTRFPKPDFGLGMHADSDLQAGKIGISAGFNLASADAIDITVYGEGGHGAAPHLTKDPIVLSAQIVTAMQTLVSRNRDPAHDAVLSVGSIHGGTKHNIIPDQVKLQATLRTYEPAARDTILEGLHRITKNLAEAAGVAKKPTIAISGSTPSLYNDPELSGRVRGRLAAAFGEHALAPRHPEMYAEDFAVYARRGKFPTVFFFVGSQSGPPKGWHGSHTARYAPAFDPTYAVGVRAMVEAVLELTRPPAG